MTTPSDAPQRLTAQLERIRTEWGSTAQQRLDDMPPRAIFEDRPFIDPEARRAARWEQAIPNRFQWAKLADLDQPQQSVIATWAEAGAITNLVLAGPVGAGKSYAAVAAARQLHDRGMEVAFWPVVNLLDGLRPGAADCDELHGRLTKDTDLLILDDLGRQRATEWADERLYAIVNDRWLDEKPTVVTTTHTESQLRGIVGDHLVSRLVGGATLVTFRGAVDRRTGRQ